METPNQPGDCIKVTTLLHVLESLRDDMLAGVHSGRPILDELDDSYRESACNLLAYLALRRHDIRNLQTQLTELGLSSLGRSEGHILSSVGAVIALLRMMSGTSAKSIEPPQGLNLSSNRALLAEHADALFGPEPIGRRARIMVTLSSEAADNYPLVRDLLAAHMDSARINSAHDGPDEWLRMIEHVRRAQRELGKHCQVMMDLAGPKMRTGRIQPETAAVKVRPVRDGLGKVLRPARIWLTALERPEPAPAAADAVIPVADDWLRKLRRGLSVSFRDTRNARRRLALVETGGESGCWAELHKTAYLISGLVLNLHDGNEVVQTTIGDIPPLEGKIPLRQGDLLQLTADAENGRPASYDSAGNLLSPAHIGCSLPKVLDQIHAGESVWFDDGKIGGVVESVEKSRLNVRITQAPGPTALKSDKGINFPLSNLHLDPLGPDDLKVLAFAIEHADLVAMSFVNRPEDVAVLLNELARRRADDIGVVLKIETRCGFENLPALLLEGMRKRRFGVMIARGDLAVEGGFERMAELQEEILCLCEASHVPVIWATQVLENLAKKGSPSRAEITDAASGVRTECVMLNKGLHVREAVRMLNDLLARMQENLHKHSQLMRSLKVARQPDIAGVLKRSKNCIANPQRTI
ncbi:pyruvate kinase [Brenneria izadpanahii]|uniref:pyruvate kinase n=1 Tax=Brenneria izadpanahii TaxID=2722756 RepID=A0ABX7UTM0_9GAMM|nr:pyruvate kinase [Brenneria izadpanahii]QTF08715.1 pyruvate kinase [Brenneria izadpanahii]